MKIHLYNLLDSHFDELLGLKLPVETAFGLRRWRGALDHHIKAFNETRRKIIEDAGITDGMAIKEIPKEKLDSVNAELKKLADQEIEVEEIGISPAELKDKKGINEVSAKMLESLSWLIKENEPVQKIGD